MGLNDYFNFHAVLVAIGCLLMTTPASSHSAPATQNDEIDLRSLLGIIWRGRFWVFLAGFLTTMLGGYYAFSAATPMFTTKATVVQETDQKPVVDFSGGLESGLNGDQSAINTEIEILRSRGLLEKLVLQLDLVTDPEFNTSLQPEPAFSINQGINLVRGYMDLPPLKDRQLTEEQRLDAVVDRLRDALSISNVRQSFVFNISATTEDPKKSTLIANSLAQLYIVDQLNVKGESNLQATAWLTDRLSQLRIELETAESRVKDFNAETDLINAETLAALNRQVKELRERLENVRAAEAELQARIALLQETATRNDPAEMANIAQDRTLNQLYGEIDTLSQAGRAAFNARFDQLITQTELERSRLENQTIALEESIAQQAIATNDQSTDLITLQQLQREAEASRLLYEYFLSRLKETSVQSGIQTPDTRLLSRAGEPLRASSPNKPVILIISLILGLMIGTAYVLLREMAQSTFRAAEELERHTGYNVLGQIPKMPARRRKKLLQYLTNKPTSATAEAVRNMRTSVLLSDADNPPQVIMSTSSVPGEGKTTQSLSLAQNLAGLGKSVLLIEGDIRKRVFSEYFTAKDNNGMMAVLDGTLPLAEAAQHETSLNADVLMSEKASTNAADLFSSAAFTKLMKQARKDYDYIVIDTPPVLAVPDARIIGRHVDTTLYTVRWDHTSHRQVSQGLKELAQVNVAVAGLVLAQIDAKGQKRYGYGDQVYGGYHDN